MIMKSVLALHPSGELYGADRIFTRCVKFMVDDGCKVDVRLANSGPLVDFLRKEAGVSSLVDEHMPLAVRSLFGVRFIFVFFIKAARFFLSSFRIRKKYDVVYINTLSLFLCVAIFKLVGCKKIVLHVHEIISGSILTNLMINIACRYSDQIICVSQAVQSDLLKLYPSVLSKSAVIWNGVSEGPGNVAGEESQCKTKFLLLGRIMPEKGHFVLLDALKMLDSEELNCISVNVVGSSPRLRAYLTKDFDSAVVKFGLSEVVFRKSFVDEPMGLVASCDIMLVPSVMRDPLPTTVLEAMAVGKPVIASSNGGARELVEASGGGVIIEPDDPKALSAAIRFYLASKDSIRAQGARGRQFYKASLTLEHFEDRFIAYVFN